MRKLLATAAAIAPLLAATGVQAEVVISNGRTTPILTSNATGTAADNIRLAAGGSITVNSGTAITIDSNNSVDIDAGGSVAMTNAADGATGILVNGGNTGGLTLGGTVTITDSIETSTDTDGDGDLDGPLAAGTGRYGVRVAGAAPFVGNILTETGSQISVQGNQSYGLSVEAPLTGNVSVLGSVAATGTDSYGVRTTGTVSGNVLLTGSSVTVNGQNAVGVAVDGAVGGRLQIQSGVATTGYRYTTRPSNLPEGASLAGSALYYEDLDADDLLQGGPAVRVSADIASGILLDRGPTYRSGGTAGDDDHDGVINGDEDDDGDGTKNSTDTDRDGDGILDTAESTASITAYGAAPALQIGSTTNTVNLGVVVTGTNAYGLVNRGTITGAGVFDGVNAQGVRIGVAGGQAVTVAGGVSNEGSISASAISANATGLTFGALTSTPTLSNRGTIQATAVTESDTHTVTAILVEAGANLPTIVNNGTISAGVGGEKATVYGVRDQSGTVTSFTNTGIITSFLTATDDARDTDDDNTNSADEVISGRNVALDFSANTSGLTLLQTGDSSRTDVDTDGDGIFDPTDTDDDGDGILDAADDADNDDDNDGVYDNDEPILIGAILLGSGADTVDIRNGTVAGDISFGAGADSLSITGGAVVRGALNDTDGQLSINVVNGTLDARQTTALNATDLTVGTDGNLVVTIDPTTSTGGFNISGTATFADGAGLGVRFKSLIETTGTERYTLINANTLNYGNIDTTSLQANSPYLYFVTPGANVAAGDVYVDVRRRSAAEAGLITAEAQIYDAFYAGLGDATSPLLAAFLAQTNREGFIDLYEQILPDHSGGPLLSLASGVDAVTRALTGRNASAQPGETSAWVQEINFYADKDKTESYGFQSEGFGFAGGVERGTTLGSFGVSVAFTSSDIEDPEAEAEEVLSASLVELGLYWRAQGQYWTTWARAAGGYATFESKRALVGAGLNLSNEANWNGFTLALAGGASYERNFGRFNVRPEIYAEYFSLNEEAYTESGGGAGFDLDIDKRDGHILSSVAAINIGYGLGRNGWIRPELRLGWRQNISVDAGDTVGRFSASGPNFTLDPASIEGGGPLVGLRLAVGNELGMLSISADAEKIEDYIRVALLLRASFKF